MITKLSLFSCVIAVSLLILCSPTEASAAFSGGVPAKALPSAYTATVSGLPSDSLLVKIANKAAEVKKHRSTKTICKPTK